MSAVRRLLRPCAIGALGMLACVGLLGLAGSVQAEPAPEETLDDPCERSVPSDWLVIDEASGAGEGNVVCNYRIGDLGGAAITVEWYCTAREGDEAWSTKTSGPRDTSTVRSETELRILEGPLAPNPDNAHRDGVTSTFFPDGVYTWFEKSWTRIGPQVISTVVVISGPAQWSDVGGVSTWVDVPRIDIEPVNAEAVGLASAAVAGPTSCATPPVVAPSSPTTPPAGRRGVPPIVIAAGGTAVVVGGVTIVGRRRRPPRPRPGPAGSTGVPPRCVDLDRSYAVARERVLTLMDAESQLHERLDKAHAIQRRNVATANLALGLDAGRLIGGPLGMVPSQQPGIVLRGTQPGYARPQWDTWRPPATLPPALAAPIASLGRAAAAASARVDSIRRQLTNVAAHPQIRLLRDRLAQSGSRLATARADLTGSQFARRDLALVAEQIGRRHDDIARGAARIAELEHNVGQLMKWTNHPRIGPTARRDLRRTLDLINEARTGVGEAQAALPGLTAQRRSLAGDLERFGNLQRADVQRMIDAQAEIARDLAATERTVRASLDRQLAGALAEETLAAQVVRAATDQALRTASEQDSFGRAALRGTTAALGTVAAPLIGPIAWLAERTFGTRQSPQEILQILQRGNEHITELMTAQHLIERALRQRRGPLELLHVRLVDCIATETKPEGSPNGQPR